MARTQIRSAQILDGDLTADDFAPAYKDGAVGTPCLRSLGTGAQQAAAGNHTHSGLVTNGNSHDHEGGDGAQIPTGGIQDGAITPQKLAIIDAVRVYNSSAISIPHATPTILTFDSERFDTNSLHSTVSNTSRLTCQRAGLYEITLNISWGYNATGRRTAAILLNGTTLIAMQIGAPAPDGGCVQSVSTLYVLSVGDYVEARVRQDSGGSLAVEAIGNISPEFAMAYIGRVA